MARFTAQLTGVYPNQVLTIRDTANGNAIIAQTAGFSQLHNKLFGTPDLPLCSCSIAVEEFERTIGIPGGSFVERGCDLVFTVSNATGSEVQVGSFNATNFRLGSSVEVMHQWVQCVFAALGTEASPSQSNYYGTKYFPGSVFRNATYNFTFYLLYNPVVHNHPVKTYEFLNSTTTPSHQLHCAFQCGNNDASFKATLQPGETRTYRLCIRIGDRTNTRVAGPDSAEEWIWLLASYRDHFRALFGKPDYRSMGGFDGRPCCGSYLAPDDGSNPSNLRRWQSNDNNPTLGAGYEKVADGALARRANNIARNMIWALSGWHSGGCQGNYPFRFATGLLELNDVAKNSIAPAMKRIRDGGMQQGFWWGLAAYPENSSMWDQAPCGSTVIDPDDHETVAKAYAELDLAVTQWGANLIGLDAFGFEKPAHAFRWLQMLKARYPNVLFVTEQALPDYLHVLAPTYIIEQPAGTQANPFWLHQFINPGGECWLQLDAYEPSGQPAKTARQRTDEVAAMGYTPVSGFFQTGGSNALAVGLRAADRWTELGESAIAGYNAPLPPAPEPEPTESIGRQPVTRRAVEQKRYDLDQITIRLIISLFTGNDPGRP